MAERSAYRLQREAVEAFREYLVANIRVSPHIAVQDALDYIETIPWPLPRPKVSVFAPALARAGGEPEMAERLQAQLDAEKPDGTD